MRLGKRIGENMGNIIKKYVQAMIIPLIILITAEVIIFGIDVKAGQIGLASLIMVVTISLIIYSIVRSQMKKATLNFAINYAKVQKKMLDEFELPYGLLDNKGKLLWFNQGFGEMMEVTHKFKGGIEELMPELSKAIIDRMGEKQSVSIEREGRFYRTELSKMYYEESDTDQELARQDEEGKYLIALYLFDETKLIKTLEENENQKLVPALVYIDNYEEVLDSIEDVKKTLLIALTDRRVNKYFTEHDGIVKKVERDKYFVVFKHQYLAQFEEDRFSLIEDVKTIRIGNEMPVTLSIGIGASDGSFKQKSDYTRAAVDLALGRGGDQVVVKSADKMTYYGGKTQQVEKFTRVKARVKAQALREIFETTEQVLVMGHQNSDVDSLGAAVGIYRAAAELEKRAYIVINDISSSLRPLMEPFSKENGYDYPLFVNREEALDLLDRNTAVVVVDTNRPSYTECPELIERASTIVVFDHHRQGAEVIENATLSYIEPYASSTCEMIAEVLQYFSEDVKLALCEADCIYAGILIDTNNFMTKTGVRTFEAAAYLRRSGAEVTRVRKLLRDDMDAYKARAEAVRNAEVYRDSFAISVCPSSGVESPTIAGAQAANELLNIVGIRASFVLTEFKDKIFVSSRSIDEINVQIIMEKLGGGGHMNVAGAQLPGYTTDEAIRKIEMTLDEMLEEGAIE